MTATAAATRDDRRLLLRITEEAYSRATWNGTNLRASLRTVSAPEASWKPRHGRRSIAEIVLHCAYWKYVLRRRLLGLKRRSFELKGSNWFPVRSKLDAGQWAEHLALLHREHLSLCRAILETGQKPRYGSASGRDLACRIFGVAMHDAYHTGQIQLIKKLYRRPRQS